MVYDVQRQRMGNTSMRTTSVFRVHIREIDPEGNWVVASWNGNAYRKFYKGSVAKWKENKPILIRSSFGSHRVATREELKAIADGTFTGEHTR